MQKNGMSVDVSWRNPARHYADLYGQVAKLRSPRPSQVHEQLDAENLPRRAAPINAATLTEWLL
jgi:hypothetical protein